MDRLISLEPSNLVVIRIEPGQKCSGQLTLRNVMYTMPVAFRLQAMNKSKYSVKPQSGIISPLATLTLEIIYHLLPGSSFPDSSQASDDSFLLHSVVVPGAAIKDLSSALDAVPNDCFTTKKKQVFIDSGIKVMFVGSPVLAQLVVMGGSMDEIREVLERSDPSWRAADSVDSKGQTLLHLATAQGRADLVQLLLEFEPDVEAKSLSGSTPLEAAAASGEALIVELLLAHHASTERSETSTWGPIHLAAGGGHLEVLKLLLLKGANVDALTKDGNTALHLAVEERRSDCARLLISNRARTNIRNSIDYETPLHVAARLGDEHLVKLLLAKGANKDIRNRLGKTAYELAAEYGHTRLFDALKLGDRLCTAARKGEIKAIHRLLENGALINGRDQHGWTALHRAALKGHMDVVKILIDKGIDMDAKDEDGYTALHCAVESGHGNVIELLVKRGADVEARTNKGITPLKIADSLHYSGISRILIHGGATREGDSQPAGPGPLPYRKKIAENGGLKKKDGRGRVLRGSFDSSLPIAVL